MTYYKEIMTKIDNLLHEGNYQQALPLIQEELSMPYIPSEIEPKLQNALSVCKANLYDYDAVLLKGEALENALLHGNLDQQGQAVESLNVSNARQYIDVIQQALISDTVEQEVKVGLVHVIKDQCIDNIYEFTLNHQLLSFDSTKVIDYLEENNVLNTFNHYIDEIIDDNPSFNRLVKQMLFDGLIHLFPIQIVSSNDYQMVLQQVLKTAIDASSIETHDYWTRFDAIISEIEAKN